MGSRPVRRHREHAAPSWDRAGRAGPLLTRAARFRAPGASPVVAGSTSFRQFVSSVTRRRRVAWPSPRAPTLPDPVKRHREGLTMSAPSSARAPESSRIFSREPFASIRPRVRFRPGRVAWPSPRAPTLPDPVKRHREGLTMSAPSSATRPGIVPHILARTLCEYSTARALPPRRGRRAPRGKR
jgi:hypothetical protein